MDYAVGNPLEHADNKTQNRVQNKFTGVSVCAQKLSAARGRLTARPLEEDAVFLQGVLQCVLQCVLQSCCSKISFAGCDTVCVLQCVCCSVCVAVVLHTPASCDIHTRPCHARVASRVFCFNEKKIRIVHSPQGDHIYIYTYYIYVCTYISIYVCIYTYVYIYVSICINVQVPLTETR